MATALIGYTGFVGGNLLRQAAWDDLYNSANIATIVGKRYDLLACAGARAEKWKANRDPDGDREHIRELVDVLATVEARAVVLVSTVDVYPTPVGVDEDSPIDPAAATAYGRHRFELEQALAARFDTLVIRLPGLFGPGLKKNIIFDLLTDNLVERIHPLGRFQYYNLDRLWADVQTARSAGLKVVNFATGPVVTRELARIAFGRDLPDRPGLATPAAYDFRSKHAGAFGGAGGYLYGGEQVLAELTAFVAAARQAQARKAA